MKLTGLGDLCFFLHTFVGILGHENGPGVTVSVEEGSDAILPCSLSSKENIESKLFDWKKDGQKEVFLYDAGTHYNNGRAGQDEQFKGRVSHFQERLKSGNASIIIRDTKVSDSGNYTCDFPRLQPRQIFHITLVVERASKDRSGEITGAAPKPYITIVDVTEDGVVLKCEVRGAFPQPKLDWKDSDGNILLAEEPQVSESGGRYDVTLHGTVTSTTTNRFRCEVKQEDIGHIVDAEISVSEKLLEDKSCPGVGVWIGVWFSGVLTVTLPLALYVGAKYIIKRRKKDSPQTNGSYRGPSEQPINSPVR